MSIPIGAALLTTAAACAMLAGCGGGDEGNGDTTGGSGGGTGGTTSSGSGASDGGTVDVGWTGSCPESLADRLRVTEIPGVMRKRIPAIIDPLPDGGARLAWPDEGEVKLARIDATEQVVGPVLGLVGVDVNGLVAHEDGAAMLLFREPDMMDLVRVDGAGTVLFETTLIGNNDHDVVGSKYVRSPGYWHHGRLRWIDGRYAVYLAHHQRWPDGIGHQGDLLWYYDGSGNQVERAWDWGCSHSLALHMTAHHGLGKVFTTCDSDGLYGGLGLDGSKNLIPGVSHGGGIAPVDDGVVVAFAKDSGLFSTDVGIIHVDADMTAGSEMMLPATDGVAEVSVHVAPYGDGFVIGWIHGSSITPWDSFGEAFLALVDGQGNILKGPESVPMGFYSREDFVVLANGDVAWTSYPTADESTWPLEVVRMRLCE